MMSKQNRTQIMFSYHFILIIVHRPIKLTRPINTDPENIRLITVEHLCLRPRIQSHFISKNNSLLSSFTHILRFCNHSRIFDFRALGSKPEQLQICNCNHTFIITNYLSGYKPVITGQLVLSPVRKLIYDFILDATVSLWYFLNAILINR